MKLANSHLIRAPLVEAFIGIAKARTQAKERNLTKLDAFLRDTQARIVHALPPEPK